jgi:UDP:flavonoid glycosyltransferase YjiC (YdhE family)
MKCLLTLSPAVGHFHAMVPLAAALRDRGHTVAFATGKGFETYLGRAGFQHFPCGLEFSGPQDLFETLPEWEAIQATAPADMGLKQLYGFIQGFAPRMADDLFGLVEAWTPDVIIRDPLEFGGYIAAERYGLPHVSTIWSTYISAKALCPDIVIELRRRYGLPDDPALDTLDRYLVLDFLPAAWTIPQLPYPPVAHRFCAPPFDQSDGGGLPDWLETLPDRPTVYATLGTTFNQVPDTFQAILAALSTEPVNLIVTVGRTMDPAQFGPQPDHIKIERYIPQTLVLPHCHALVFHGGYNSLLSALWHGLPMVITPGGAGDNWPTGWRCAAVGAGVLVEGNPPKPEALRAAVRAVVEQPGYRACAQDLQREMKALPSLAEAVTRLEILSKTRAPQVN